VKKSTCWLAGYHFVASLGPSVFSAKHLHRRSAPPVHIGNKRMPTSNLRLSEATSSHTHSTLTQRYAPRLFVLARRQLYLLDISLDRRVGCAHRWTGAQPPASIGDTERNSKSTRRHANTDHSLLSAEIGAEQLFCGVGRLTCQYTGTRTASPPLCASANPGAVAVFEAKRLAPAIVGARVDSRSNCAAEVADGTALVVGRRHPLDRAARSG
jgi:hypothetical protein